jgi:hypothetical protein
MGAEGENYNKTQALQQSVTKGIKKCAVNSFL